MLDGRAVAGCWTDVGTIGSAEVPAVKEPTLLATETAAPPCCCCMPVTVVLAAIGGTVLGMLITD